ncbi:DMT family transporter [Sphingomonas sp. DG1-23]|uniref:DMT family transporter n=1 Tax=Sphingomonas sp. DG1-23 TaxID=3068316 RepID=UPI00273D8CDF|nr:DMT family transporter [Sphingomonas sp. DG1-23]
MSPEALAPAMMIASGSIHAMVNAILKGGKDKMAGRAVIDGSSAVLLLPALLFVPLPHGAWGWLAATAVIHCVYLYALVRAFETSDFSAAYPILRGTAPLVTAALAIGVFGEAASARELAGIAAIGGAMFVMVAGRHIGRAGLGWALLTGMMVAAYTVVDAQGVRAAPTPLSFIVWMFVLMGSATVTMFALVSRGRIFASARTQWRAGAVAGALSILTYGLALSAFALGPTAPLAALRETGMVTALLIATFVLKERVTAGRAVGVLGILGGALLILTR